MAYLQPIRICPPCCWNSTVVRAHVSAAGTPKNKGTEPALGRSRGGFSTPIHILADRQGRSLSLRVTGGLRHARTQARALAESWTGASPSCLISDQAYDGDAFRA